MRYTSLGGDSRALNSSFGRRHTGRDRRKADFGAALHPALAAAYVRYTSPGGDSRALNSGFGRRHTGRDGRKADFGRKNSFGFFMPDDMIAEDDCLQTAMADALLNLRWMRGGT